jgi:phospholipid transport system substrate-binding protein
MLLAAFVAGLAFAASASDAPDDAKAAEAREVLARAVAYVDAVVRDAGATPEEKRALIERKLRRRLDIGFITTRALGARAEQFSTSQLADFSREFERFLLDHYLVRIARSRDHTGFEIGEATWDPHTGAVTVSTRGGPPLDAGRRQLRVRGAEPSRIDYRLRKMGGEWRIVSLVIDRVSVVRLFHDQFASVIDRSGPDELIAEIRKLNARREQTNPFSS